MIKRDALPLKTEPVKDLIPEFTALDTLQELTKLAQVKGQIAAVNAKKNSATQMLGGITEYFETIIEKLVASGVDDKMIDNMTDEEIAVYYTLEDGEPIVIDIPMESKAAVMDFKRDYLSMLVQNSTAFKQIDETLGSLDDAMVEYDDKIRGIHADTNGDIIKYVRSELMSRAEDPEEDPRVVKGISEVVAAIDWSYNLEPLLEYYSKLDPRNTINDFVHRDDVIFKKFVKNCRANGIVVNYSRFDKFEARYLNERFHKYSELLPFLVMKMYANKKEFSRLDSILLLQLNSNLQILFYEQDRGLELTQQQLEERYNLTESAEKLLSLFM